MKTNLSIDFQSGDTEAFNPLVLKYQKKIYSLMYQRVRDQEAAKDLCQEVFLKAFKALPNFKGGSAFYSWIYRIAINCSIDFQRQRNRGKIFPFEELSPENEDMLKITDPHPSPDRILEEEGTWVYYSKGGEEAPTRSAPCL